MSQPILVILESNFKQRHLMVKMTPTGRLLGPRVGAGRGTSERHLGPPESHKEKDGVPLERRGSSQAGVCAEPRLRPVTEPNSGLLATRVRSEASLLVRGCEEGECSVHRRLQTRSPGQPVQTP